MDATAFAVMFQAGLLVLVSRILRKTELLSQQVRKSEVLAKEVEKDLVRLRQNCAARYHFIEFAGAELLECSRAVYDAAGFLNSKRQLVRVPLAGGGIEENLLKNAGRVFLVSHDIVALTQLRRGDVRLLEQEIDPVELVSWCATEVWKKISKRSNY